MLRVNMNENVAAHKAPERQATVQEKLSAGRAVGQNPVTARIPGRMAEASSTSRRTITHHSEAVKRTADFPAEAASAKKPGNQETRKPGNQETRKPKELETTRPQRPWTFKTQVNNAIRKLYEIRDKSNPDNFSFCLIVIDTYRMLKQELQEEEAFWMPADRKDCHQHLISETSPFYNANLNEIWNFFQDQIATGAIWIYADEFKKVAESLGTLGYETSNATNNKAALTKLWNLYLNKELEYLEYLKGFPEVSYSARRTVDNISWLISPSSPASTLELMSDVQRKEISKQANSLYEMIIRSDMAHNDAGKKRNDVLHEATDTMMDKRKHHDRLFEQFDALHNDDKSAQKSGNTRIFYGYKHICRLEKSAKLYELHNKLVDNPNTLLFRELERRITLLLNETRNKLIKNVYDDDQKLKKRALLLVDTLKEEKWLSKECKNPYSGCAQPQSTVIPAVRKDKITHEQFHEWIDDVLLILISNNQEAYMMALKKIKQLHDRKDELKKMPKNESKHIRMRMTNLEKKLFAKLFSPILGEYSSYYPCTPQNAAQAGAAMYRHKNRIIELNPYVSTLVHDNKSWMAWQTAASYAWFNELTRLNNKESFTEDDVNNLIDLKDVAPDIPSYNVGNYLKPTLVNLFKFMLQTNPETTLIGKVTELSEWANNMECPDRDTRKNLRKYNKAWQETYVIKGGRATTSSSTSATGMPSFVHPDILGAFPETFDCHSSMRLQNVPYMEQSAISWPDVPTPAHCSAFWQPGSSPWCAPIAQSATESSPFLPLPWLIEQPFFPHAPALACNNFHQIPVCGQIQPWWQQTTLQQQYELRSTLLFEYRSEYPFGSQ